MPLPLKLATDRQEASRGLSATAQLVSSDVPWHMLLPEAKLRTKFEIIC